MLLATLCNIVIILGFSVQATPAPQSSSSGGVVVPTIPSSGSGDASSEASDSSTRNSASRYRNPDGTSSNSAGRYRNPDGTYPNTAGRYRNSDGTYSTTAGRYRNSGSTDPNNPDSQSSTSGYNRDATQDSDSQRAYGQGARRYTDQRNGNSQSSTPRYRTQGISFQQADASTSGYQTIIKSSQTCTLTPPASDKGKEKIGDDCTSFGVPGKYKAIVDCPMDMSEAGDYSQDAYPNSNGIQCCAPKPCTPPATIADGDTIDPTSYTGKCMNKHKGANCAYYQGSYVENLCPGPWAIQCCIIPKTNLPAEGGA